MWSNLAVFRGPDPAAGGFWGGVLSGLENRGHEGSVYVRFWAADSGAVEAVWSARWQVFGHVCAPPLHEKMHVLVCTLLESFRPPPPRAQV